MLASRSALLDELPARPAGFAEGGVPALADAHGRAYTYLRLSVTAQKQDIADPQIVELIGHAGFDWEARERSPEGR